MFTAHHLNKTFGIHTVIEDVSFSLQAGEKVGLVGPNGCGKSTLLRILAGEITPDSGSVQFSSPGLSLAYLPQMFPGQAGETIESFLETPDYLSLRLASTAMKLSVFPEEPAIQTEYDSILQKLAAASMHAGQMFEILSALDLALFSLDTPIQRLSGGQKTRLVLVKILLSDAALLLLDEPTNHLDLKMLGWLEEWISHCFQTVLMVSHDRAFLNQTVERILELDPKTRHIKSYEGGYDDYIEQKNQEIKVQWQAYQDQKDEIDRLQQAAQQVRSLTRFKKGGKGDTRDAWSPGFFANRTMETMRRAKNLEKRLEKLKGDDRIERPEQSPQMKMEFEVPVQSNREIIRLEKITIGFPGKHLIKEISTSVRYGERIALLGANGCGKTSLVRTLIAEIGPISGGVHWGSKTKIGYLPQEHHPLLSSSTPLETIQDAGEMGETEARSFLSKYLFKGDGVFKKTGNLSHGEKARLLLAKLAIEGCNFLVLDEPINHLDIPSRVEFEQALNHFEGAVLAVIHDRVFVQEFATMIWEIADQTLLQYPPSQILDFVPETDLTSVPV